MTRKTKPEMVAANSWVGKLDDLDKLEGQFCTLPRDSDRSPKGRDEDSVLARGRGPKAIANRRPTW